MEIRMTPSPLRYPGSKANLRSQVYQYFEAHNLFGSEFTEPFAGGASVGLFLMENRFVSHYYLVDVDEALCAFWSSVFNHSEELCERIDQQPVTIEYWHYCHDLVFKQENTNEQELAAAYLFLNRTSYSGIVGAGPIGGKDQNSEYAIGCRYNKGEVRRRIDYFSQFSESVTVINDDGINVIKSKSADELHAFYVDPPYYQYGKKFYRHHFEEFDHQRLSKALADVRGQWLLSYDDEREIEALYAKFSVMKVSWRNVARQHNHRWDLLISNSDNNCLQTSITQNKLEFIRRA